jgi:membrane protease subunit HflC
MRSKWIVLVAAILVAAACLCVIFVDEAEFVIVTQFGRPIHTLREAGLHFKAPYQSTIRIDRRLQIYNPRPAEFLAKEKKNIDLDVFVCWCVEDPQKFIETVNDFAGAEARLHDIVWSELAAEIGRNPLEALVSTEPNVHRLDEIVGALAARCAQRAQAAYGIRIADVRLKRLGLPAQVRDSVFQRMRAERSRIARQYRAEGEEEALKIRAMADKDRTVTLAKAYAEAEKTRGKAEAEATRIYADAHQKDPAFYELVRTLEAYRKFLDDKTTILLSADSELLKFLTREPQRAPNPAPAAPQPKPTEPGRAQ